MEKTVMYKPLIMAGVFLATTVLSSTAHANSRYFYSVNVDWDRRTLIKHEEAGGHAIASHYNKSWSYLRGRCERAPQTRYINGVRATVYQYRSSFRSDGFHMTNRIKDTLFEKRSLISYFSSNSNFIGGRAVYVASNALDMRRDKYVQCTGKGVGRIVNLQNNYAYLKPSIKAVVANTRYNPESWWFTLTAFPIADATRAL